MTAFIWSSKTSKTVFELYMQPHITSGERDWNSGYFGVEEDTDSEGAQRSLLSAGNFFISLYGWWEHKCVEMWTFIKLYTEYLWFTIYVIP